LTAEAALRDVVNFDRMMTAVKLDPAGKQDTPALLARELRRRRRVELSRSPQTTAARHSRFLPPLKLGSFARLNGSGQKGMLVIKLLITNVVFARMRSVFGQAETG
jgi:hypothetical protein